MYELISSFTGLDINGYYNNRGYGKKSMKVYTSNVNVCTL